MELYMESYYGKKKVFFVFCLVMRRNVKFIYMAFGDRDFRDNGNDSFIEFVGRGWEVVFVYTLDIFEV